MKLSPEEIAAKKLAVVQKVLRGKAALELLVSELNPAFEDEDGVMARSAFRQELWTIANLAHGLNSELHMLRYWDEVAAGEREYYSVSEIMKGLTEKAKPASRPTDNLSLDDLDL